MSQRFFLLPDGWWRDTATGLEWSPTATDMMNRDDAVRWCEKQGGRLPTRTELYALVDDSLYGPCTELPDTRSSDYWSASTYAPGPFLAWIVDFYGGGVYANGKTDSGSVRAVRGGSSTRTLDHSTIQSFSLAELADELQRRICGDE